MVLLRHGRTGRATLKAQCLRGKASCIRTPDGCSRYFAIHAEIFKISYPSYVLSYKISCLALGDDDADDLDFLITTDSGSPTLAQPSAQRC